MENYNEKINAALAHLCILSDKVFQPYFANILCAQELIKVMMKDKTIELVKIEALKNNNDDIQKRLRYSLVLITSKLTEKGTKYKYQTR